MADLAGKKRTLIGRLVQEKVLHSKPAITAFRKVPRERFLLPDYRPFAYADEPLPTLAGQTISQPTTTAIMTEALELKQGMKVLEIGAGSGYQAALISEIIGPKGKVFTIEILEELYEFAKRNLLDYKNVKVILGDGSKGYKKEAPFDRIIVTAATAKESKATDKLFGQLKENGILVIPVGDFLYQDMLVIKKANNEKLIKSLGQFVFVPLREKYDRV